MAIVIEAGAEPIPGYTLIEPLGRGGFGEVWKAMAPGGIPKAIKFVIGSLEEADGHVPAAQELKSLNRVKDVHHSFILAMERVDIVEGRLIIVMELADRNMLHRLEECQAQGLPGIPRAELLRYMAETAEALDLMNGEFALQHLDIKPANLFLVYNHVKVADFGLAKDLQGMTAAVTSGLTPVYASPETFEGTVSRFSDQYSLAIVYQELLTGKRPIAGTNGRQLAMAHVMGQPDLSPLPPGDREIVGRALAKKPAERFPSCGEFIGALRKAPAARAEPAAAPSPATPAAQRGLGRQEASAVPPAPQPTAGKRQHTAAPSAPRAGKATAADLALAETTKESTSRDVEGTPVGRPGGSEDRRAKSTGKRHEPEPESADPGEPGPERPSRKSGASAKKAAAASCPRCAATLLDPGAHAWCSSCGYCRDLEKEEQPARSGSFIQVLIGGLVVGAVVGLGGWFAAPWLRSTNFRMPDLTHASPVVLALGAGIVAVIVLYAAWAIAGKRKRPRKKRRARRASPS